MDAQKQVGRLPEHQFMTEKEGMSVESCLEIWFN